jgi:beta-N-acetylhexosaminidase
MTMTTDPGPVMLDLTGQAVTAEERDLLCHPLVGGVIFFDRNIGPRGAFQELVASVREIRPGLLLAVDQEGGRVQRLQNGYTKLPAMQRLGEICEREPELGAWLCRETGWLLASEVLASGLDFSFAPVLDLDRDYCAVIAERAFHLVPDVAIAALRAFIAGLHEAGMAATGKHFPGHGGVRGDSHLETPTDARPLAAIRARDLRPFAELASELEAVMPAHILYPLADTLPAGFSRYWLQEILRNELGFAGVIFSDDLAMQGAAAVGSYADRARAALAAGCDMVLVCNDRRGALEVLTALERSDPAEDGGARLRRMRARARPEWGTLVGGDRHATIRTALARL